MSRIGKKIIQIPQNIEVKIEGRKVWVKGPKGELNREFRPEVQLENKDNVLSFSIKEETKLAKSLWGLSRMLLFNMIKGVTEGFEKKLDVQGVGYKAEVSGNEVVLSLGFTHPVKIKFPETIKATVEKNIITISGPDKELVGQISANIRKSKSPDPYKGKGVRYFGEVIKKKAGKKVAGSTTAK